MYPQPIILREQLLNKENKYLIPEENKKLCKDICIVSSCLTGFCVIYCIIFLGVIDEELDMDIMNITDV